MRQSHRWAVLVLVVLGACGAWWYHSHSAATLLGVVDNGDKPGIVYQVRVRGGRVVAAQVYLTDPSTPEDVYSGREITTVVDKSDATSITLRLSLDTVPEWVNVIRVPEWSPERTSATLLWQDGQSEPLELVPK